MGSTQRPEGLKCRKLLVVGLVAMTWMGRPASARGDTYVTTYVTKVQEERESTRWTLTEWLRIKERMRMMDLWLAMFSKPDTDRFQPEINLSYGVDRGQLSLTNADAALDESTAQAGTTAGVHGRAQLWLTNLISGTIGVRTLNVDLGGEAYQRTNGGVIAAQITADGTPGDSQPMAGNRSHYFAGTLRVFGKHIQDSSLVLKYGQYKIDHVSPQWSDSDADGSRQGRMAGAELNVYVLPWLGIQGNYIAYGDGRSVYGSDEFKGSHMDYMAFVEVSLLRLMFGRYQDEWTYSTSEQSNNLNEAGVTFGGQVSL